MKRKNTYLLITLLCSAILSGCGLLPNRGEKDAPDPAQTQGEDIKLEANDWTNIWVENANQNDLPRILFVGDSILDGYYSRVIEDLTDQYYPARYTTSKFISNPDFQDELALLLNRYDFSIILLNNGLHGWDYSISEYRAGLEEMLTTLAEYAPEASLVWCQTTPVRLEENLDALDPLNREVIRRNQTAADVMAENGVLVLDLYQAMLPYPQYYKTDGIHFKDSGRDVQADLVSSFLLSLP